MAEDPRRQVSVVAYFTTPSTYTGGILQVKLPAPFAHGSAAANAVTETAGGARPAVEVMQKRYEPGWAVAFPSKTLEHGVTPVTDGERRSLLLIVGNGQAASGVAICAGVTSAVMTTD